VPLLRIIPDETHIRFMWLRRFMLPLSAIATAGYSFNIRAGMKFLYGRKIIQRAFNPDGLTRHDVMTISYYYRF
jgi:hypothetical protein